MNIHIEKDYIKLFKDNSYLEIEFGSSLYGSSTKDSDKDIMFIYPVTNWQKKTIFNTHHQLQFKKDNVDYILTDVNTFVKNLLTGDATINFEVIHSDKLIGTKLEFLYTNRKKFYTYNVLRAYLGFAKRDLKHITKKTDERDKNKTIFHVWRGLKAFKDISENNYKNKLTSDELDAFKKFMTYDYKDRKVAIDLLKKDCEEKRLILNEQLNNRELTKFLDIEFQKELDEWILELNNTEFDFNDNEILSKIYEANEKGVEY